MVESLEAGFLLDRRWHRLGGEMERSKQPDLAALVKILSSGGVSCAVIGGVALRIHLKDPRTTIVVEIALPDRGSLPRGALIASGFKETGRFAHGDDWVGPDGTPVQFTDDPALHAAISRAVEVPAAGLRLRVLRAADLIHEKIRSGRDPVHRRSKRLQDLADVESLLEQDPSLAAAITPDERALLDSLPE